MHAGVGRFFFPVCTGIAEGVAAFGAVTICITWSSEKSGPTSAGKLACMYRCRSLSRSRKSGKEAAKQRSNCVQNNANSHDGLGSVS